jgi:hypothetical protein
VAAFVDFKKAFDSIDQDRMCIILEAQGFPDKVIALVKLLYKGAMSCVRVRGDTSEYFEVKTGVKQGALLSPVLFILVLDHILHQMESQADVQGLEIDNALRLVDLDYADDLALLTSSTTEMQRLLDCLDDAATRVGLVISAEKTKIMANEAAISAGYYAPVQYRGTDLQLVDTFCYLGSIISMNGDGAPEISTRIAKAEGAFALLSGCLWSNDRISLATKLSIYYASVRPVLLYGCETWPLRAADLNRLQSFEHRCWRRILRISYLDHVSNADVQHRIRPRRLCSQEIKHRRLTYCGHVLRRDHDFIPRRCLMEKPKPVWKRPPGGVRMNWQRTVQNDLQPLKLPRVYADWKTDWRYILNEIAQDRNQWRTMVNNLMKSG